MEDEKLNIKTKDGIAEPLPLSDIQRNNRILLALTIAVYIIIIIVVWGIWYIIDNNVVGNILRVVGNC